MAQFHFVEDYEQHVRALKANHPLDEAMALAVGGKFEEIGAIQAAILATHGLKDGHRLVDLGCGSGRTAWAVSQRFKLGAYLGIDIVQDLLDYAASRCPRSYRFVMNRALSVPALDKSADMVCAFSLFTHLLHEETYLYLGDLVRVLRPGGRVVFSFLEFAIPSHWRVFEVTIEQVGLNQRPHLNMFMDRGMIETFAGRLGFSKVEFVSGDQPHYGGKALGQSTAVLTL